MILIQNIKPHVGKKDGKTFKTFTVLGTFEGSPVEVKGFRYFDESGTVKPPSMKMGAFFHPTFGAPDELLKAIKRAYETQELGENLDGYGTATAAWESFQLILREEQEEEALAAFSELKNLTLEQQIVRLLLEVAVNPVAVKGRGIEEVFGVQ